MKRILVFFVVWLVLFGACSTQSANSNPCPYSTEADFLNSVDGAAFQIVAYKAAKALLSADAGELSTYLLDPSEAAGAVKGIHNMYDNVEYLILIWSRKSIKSDEQINASYRFALSGEDSASFVSLELVKTDDVWKVRWLGIEK